MPNKHREVAFHEFSSRQSMVLMAGVFSRPEPKTLLATFLLAMRVTVACGSSIWFQVADNPHLKYEPIARGDF